LWDLESGTTVQANAGMGFEGPLIAVSWSPNEHLVAMCAFGDGAPVLLCEGAPQTLAPDAARALAILDAQGQ
jgi:hypothetical protein